MDSIGRKAFATSMAHAGEWFWSLVRGDKAALRRMGFTKKVVREASGARLDNSGKIQVLRWVGNGYYCTHTQR